MHDTPTHAAGWIMDTPVPPCHLARDTFSPLVLVDRLISLARDADRAGHGRTASRLVELAHVVCDELLSPAAH